MEIKYNRKGNISEHIQLLRECSHILCKSWTTALKTIDMQAAGFFDQQILTKDKHILAGQNS